MFVWCTGSPLPPIDDLSLQSVPSKSSKIEKTPSKDDKAPLENMKKGNEIIEDYMRKYDNVDVKLFFKLIPQMLKYEPNKRIGLSKYAFKQI